MVQKYRKKLNLARKHKKRKPSVISTAGFSKTNYLKTNLLKQILEFNN